MSAVERAIEARLQYLRRELEIAEREAARQPFDFMGVLPVAQRAPFEAVNRDIEVARAAIPIIRAEISDLTESH